MRQILFYPGILIPSEWLKKTVFYSDKISSIYPMQFNVNSNFEQGDEERYAQTNMEYLESIGLYEKTQPEDFSYKVHKDSLVDLMEILDEGGLHDARERYKQYRSSYQIYRSKINDETCSFLIENQIAKYDDQMTDSILVESKVGLLYMSLLAHNFSKADQIYTTSTNEIQHQDLIFDRNTTLPNDYYLNMIFNEIPSPSSDATLESIITFKETRRSELLAFRRYIATWVENIQTNPTRVNVFRDEFESYKLEIIRLMNESRIPVVGSTLEIVVPPLAGVVAQYINKSLEESDIVSAAASTVASILIGKIKSRTDKAQDNKPLSYLYHASKSSIIKKL